MDLARCYQYQERNHFIAILQNTQSIHYKQDLNYIYWLASSRPSLGMIHITVLARRIFLISNCMPFAERNYHPNDKMNQFPKQCHFEFSLGFPYTDVTSLKLMFNTGQDINSLYYPMLSRRQSTTEE